MNDTTDVEQETAQVFEVMPGADKIDDGNVEALDLSFDTEETVEEVAEDAAVEVAAEEEVEEVEEVEEAAEAEEVEEVAEDAEEVAEAAAIKETEPKKSPMVPKSRLDEVLAKQKALQKQLDDIKAADEKSEDAPEEYDFDAKEVEYQSMVLDGETEKAVALRREIRQAERASVEYEMQQKMSKTVEADRANTALQSAASALEEAYPVFDHNSELFNKELTDEVVELRDAFMIKGYEPVDALSKAVNFVVKDNGLDAAEETSSLATLTGKSDEVAKKRAQVKRKLAAADSQPPELPGESKAKPDVSNDISSMSEDEFNALPEATLRRLRGDIL